MLFVWNPEVVLAVVMLGTLGCTVVSAFCEACGSLIFFWRFCIFWQCVVVVQVLSDYYFVSIRLYVSIWLNGIVFVIRDVFID